MNGKQLLCDIDGVLLPAKPDSRLPYMLRLTYLRDLCERWRKEHNLSPINNKLITEDNFDKRETTDLGYVITLLYPDHNPFVMPESRLWDLIPQALDLIKQSEDYYFKLLSEQNSIDYEPNPGIRDFLKQCINNKWTLVIASGNPRAIALSKLKLSGLYDLFDGYNLKFGEHGDNCYFRDHIIERAISRSENNIYIGDRVSDVGVITRVHGMRGIIIPSFENNKLYSPRITTLVDSKKVLIVDSLAEFSTRVKVLDFMESNWRDIETRLPVQVRK